MKSYSLYIFLFLPVDMAYISSGRMSVFKNWVTFSPLKKLRSYVHQKTCSRMFTRELLIITKNWKPPKYPPSIEWINTVILKYLSISCHSIIIYSFIYNNNNIVIG